MKKLVNFSRVGKFVKRGFEIRWRSDPGLRVVRKSTKYWGVFKPSKGCECGNSLSESVFRQHSRVRNLSPQNLPPNIWA